MTAPIAVVRDVGASYARCLVRTTPRPPIDVARARAQHDAYVLALRDGGYDVIRLAADEAHPDGCFVEDGVVVLDEVAILTRPGAPSRRSEVESLAEAVRPLRPLVRIEAPGTLDGGDVLRVGRRLYVGRSARTDRDAHRQLERIATRCGYVFTSVPVRDGLHLKSGVTALDDTTLLIDPSAVAPESFEGLNRLECAADETAGANVLRLARPGRLLAAAAFPETAERLRREGFEVTEVDLSEFTAGDAGPTCLSVRIGRDGGPAGQPARSEPDTSRRS